MSDIVLWVIKVLFTFFFLFFSVIIYVNLCLSSQIFFLYIVSNIWLSSSIDFFKISDNVTFHSRTSVLFNRSISLLTFPIHYLINGCLKSLYAKSNRQAILGSWLKVFSCFFTCIIICNYMLDIMWHIGWSLDYMTSL